MFDNCVQTSFLKKNGSLIIIPCTFVQNTQKINAYEYDGFDAYNIELVIPELGSELKIIACDRDSEGNIYGYINDDINSNKSKSIATSCLFEFNSKQNSWNFTFLKDENGDTLNIRNVKIYKNNVYVLTYGARGAEIITVSDNGLTNELITGIDLKQGNSDNPFKFHVTDENFFIINAQHKIYTFNRINNTLDSIIYPGKFILSAHNFDEFIDIEGFPLFFTNAVSGKAFSIDGYSHEIVPFWPSFMKHIKDAQLFVYQDETGNTLFISTFNESVLESFFLSKEGTIGNYLEVANQISKYGNENFSLININSYDFSKEVFISGASFAVIEINSKEPIESFAAGQTRAISYLTKDQLLINKTGTYHLTTHQFSSKKELYGLDTIDLNPDCNIIETKDERLIASAINDRLLIINKRTNSSNLYPIGGRIRRMVTYNDGEIIAIVDGSLVKIQIENGASTHLLDYDLDFYVNDMKLNNNDELLLGTSDGLYKFNLKSKQLTFLNIGGLPSEQQVIDVLYDDTGKIWLATFSQGIKILNENYQIIQEINEDKGLSNNIAVTLLKDNQGEIWVGTYNGITILNSDGTIFGQIFESDGLIDNECNRWSALKLTDGRLAFGSVKGVSIIDPVEIKKNILDRKKPKIYLTQIELDGNKLTIGHDEFKNQISNGLSLSARNRNLILSYSLSNYSQHDKNTFAYKIEREGETWNYIGSLHKLYLHNLPQGSYNILLKGYDYRGQESENILSLSVTVAPFFYNTWWFYILISAPILLFTYLWIKRQKNENQRLESEVLSRTQTIREQSEALKEMDLLKSKMYTNITHEFRTPLTVITGLTDRMLEDQKAPEMIKRNANNLLNLVNQMLELQKIEAGKLSPEYIQGDLVAFLSYIGESIRSMAELKGIKYHFLAPKEPVILDFDPEKISRIITNLLSNAIKFTPKGGDIYLHVEDIKKPENQIRFHVRDNGIGIIPENLDKIFDRYFQETTNQHLETSYGTGIGLALVKEIVLLLGGTISVSSKPGSGADFSVVLPVSQNAEIKQTNELFIEHKPLLTFNNNGVQNYNDHLKEQTSDSKQGTILIVEDNPDVIHYIGSCLKEKYYLLIAMNGQDGIEKAISEVPDLIVSDVMMPIRDGYELCNVIKQDERTSHIPIILLTAKADIDSKIIGIKKGADAYLPKPFNEEELHAYISQLILQRKKLQERYQSFSNISPSKLESIQQEDQFILKFTSILLDQIEDENIGVSEMAEALGLSRNQLHNKITALTGQTVSQYMRHIRLSEALKHMGNDQLTISEIAFRVGFKDPKYFGRVFKEVFGKSPSEFIEKL